MFAGWILLGKPRPDEGAVILAEGEDHPPQKHQDRHTDPHPALQLYKGEE